MKIISLDKWIKTDKKKKSGAKNNIGKTKIKPSKDIIDKKEDLDIISEKKMSIDEIKHKYSEYKDKRVSLGLLSKYLPRWPWSRLQI